MDDLVFDRESAVPLNVSDLNRIEAWTAYLAEYLSSLGYPVIVRTRTWTMRDVPWQREIDRIRGNIRKLYHCYRTLPEWREITTTNSLDFTQVNVMEWDLQTIYTWLCRMTAVFWHSGGFSLNEGGIA